MITPPRSGGSGLTGKSGRKTANVCDASTREMNINTAANFMLVAFIKNQSLFIILLRDLPAQVLKTLPELEKS